MAESCTHVPGAACMKFERAKVRKNTLSFKYQEEVFSWLIAASKSEGTGTEAGSHC